MTIDTAQHVTDGAGGRRSRARAAGEGPRTVELTWIGNGGWRATDTTVPADDARCVLAYVECIDNRVEVTWIGSRRPPSFYDSLRDAYNALNRDRD